MKLLAATLSSLLVSAANAFSPTRMMTSKVMSVRSSSNTALSLNSGNINAYDASSYLGSLSTTRTDSIAAEMLNSSRRAASTSSASPSLASSPTTMMNLEVADILANGIIATAKRNNFPPVVVTIVDTQANILVQKRMDNVLHVAFPEFSYAKAYTCVTMNVSSRGFRDKYTKDNDAAKIGQMNSMMAISQKMAAFPGGVLLRNEEGGVVGAIGVSGAAGDEDEYVALVGAWESGLDLVTEPKEHSCTTMIDR